MYTDTKKRRLPLLISIVVILFTAVSFSRQVLQVSGRDMEEESEAAMREAIQRSARQCYVVEGVYPPGLSYLEENYGLKINTEDYYVTYDIFASNLPPDIMVAKKR